MASGGSNPRDTQEILALGEVLAIVSGSTEAVKKWVDAIGKYTGSRVAWTETNNVGNLLHLGDQESRTRVMEAITLFESFAHVRIDRMFPGG
jgi:hypothetical protein